MFFQTFFPLITCLSYWLYLSSECGLASLGSPCTNLEATDCLISGEHCCCGQCPNAPWIRLACVPDSTTGAGLWQMLSPCPADGCGSGGEWFGDNCQKCSLSGVQLERLLTTGVVLSPNHPKSYPHNLERTDTIQAESGKMLRLEFTRFQVVRCSSDTANCSCDYVKIVEGDGTTLMDRGCGYSTTTPSSSWYFLPPIFITKTNAVDIFFYTDGSGAAPGWSLKWTAVTPGLTTLLTIVSSWSVTLPW